VDTTKDITHVSLCAGYGGIDLGLKRAIPGLRTIAFSEIEAFACANLVAKMEAGFLDPAPIWTNVKTFPFGRFRGKVGILSAGYPCQPFSAAGNRLGTEDPRHLWPFIADGIAAMRPEWCFFENVEGHISLGLSNVIEDLAGMGYRTTWGLFSAAEVGAPHQRKRVFILAHRDNAGLEGFNNGDASTESSNNFRADTRTSGQRFIRDVWPSRPSQPQHGWEPPRVVGNAEERNSRGDALQLRSGQIQYRGASGCIDFGRRQTESSLGGDSDGPAGGLDYAELCVASDNRTDELRLLGNGVVPATAERAFTTLLPRLLTYA
jgi:site-specific DNA-cytosine methylase